MYKGLFSWLKSLGQSGPGLREVRGEARHLEAPAGFEFTDLFEFTDFFDQNSDAPRDQDSTRTGTPSPVSPHFGHFLHVYVRSHFSHLRLESRQLRFGRPTRSRSTFRPNSDAPRDPDSTRTGESGKSARLRAIASPYRVFLFPFFRTLRAIELRPLQFLHVGKKATIFEFSTHPKGNQSRA